MWDQALVIFIGLLAFAMITIAPIVLNLTARGTTCCFLSTPSGLIRMRRNIETRWSKPLHVVLALHRWIDQTARPSFWLETRIDVIRRDAPLLVDEINRLDALCKQGAFIVWEDLGLFVAFKDMLLSADTEECLKELSSLSELSLQGCTVRYGFLCHIANRCGLRLMDLSRSVILDGEVALLRATYPDLSLLA